MSNAAIYWAYHQTAGGVAQKSVLVVLADLADEEHSCWPSMEYIAERAEVGTRSVKRYLSQLSDRGLIGKERRDSGYGRRLTDRYILDVDGRVSATRRHTKLVSSQDASSQGANLAPCEKTPDQKQGARLAPCEDSGAPQGANCGTYIVTPHEINDYIINQAGERASGPASLETGSSADETAERSDDDQQVSGTVDRELEKVHPSLSVEAITARLRVADASCVDLVVAAAAIVARSSKPISSYPAFVAAGIDRAPEAWPVWDAPSTPTARDQERAGRDACRHGQHDWGPEVWGELARAHCARCGIPRRQVDQAFAELENEHDSVGGGL